MRDSGRERIREGKEQRETERARNDELGRFAVDVKQVETSDGDRRRRDTAKSETSHDAPIDSAVVSVDYGSARLRDRSIDQVRAHGRRGVDAEHNDQDRGHERPSTYASHPDEAADEHARQHVTGVDGRQEAEELSGIEHCVFLFYAVAQSAKSGNPIIIIVI